MKKEAISEHHLEQAARREAAAAMWMQHIATNVTSVAEELARITAAGHKLHGTDLPEPMELEDGAIPKPAGPRPRRAQRRPPRPGSAPGSTAVLRWRVLEPRRTRHGLRRTHQHPRFVPTGRCRLVE
jgi:hypothetical protein